MEISSIQSNPNLAQSSLAYSSLAYSNLSHLPLFVWTTVASVFQEFPEGILPQLLTVNCLHYSDQEVRSKKQKAKKQKILKNILFKRMQKKGKLGMSIQTNNIFEKTNNSFFLTV